MSSKEAKAAAVTQAMGVASDITSGRLSTDDLERQAQDAVLELAGQVVGPGDPVWPVQVSICRRVLSLDGIPYDELREWLGVHGDRPKPPVVEAEPMLPEVDSEPRTSSIVEDFEPTAVSDLALVESAPMSRDAGAVAELEAITREMRDRSG